MQTTSLRDARRVILENIDAALAVAPTEFSLGYKRDRHGEIESLPGATGGEPIARITFSAPGVGKFTVLNTRERLTSFRAEIAKNSGFNAAYRGKPQASRASWPVADSIKSMLATRGEIVSGYELAALRGLKIDFVVEKINENCTEIHPQFDGKFIKSAFFTFHSTNEITSEQAEQIWLDAAKSRDGITDEPEAIAAPQPAPAPASDSDELAKLKAEFEQLLAENKMILDQLDAYKSRESESGRADAIEHAENAVTVAKTTAKTWYESVSTIARLTRAYRGKNSTDIREALNVASATICTINREIDEIAVSVTQ